MKKSLVFMCAFMLVIIGVSGKTRAVWTDGYWDLFAVDLNPNGMYWNLVNGGAGVLSDPLVFPDPDGSAIICLATPMGGVAYGFGGHDWGTGTLETDVGGYSIQLMNQPQYYLSVVLDTRTFNYTDNLYPSWGTFSSITVSPSDGAGGWLAPIVPNWVLSPYDPGNGTVLNAGVASSVQVGVNDVNDAEWGTQLRSIFGAAATLPAAPGYKVDFYTNLTTWDSYTLGGGQRAICANYVPPPSLVPGKEFSNYLDKDCQDALDPLQNVCWDPSPCVNTFDYSGSNTDFTDDNQVDALANSRDALYHCVIQDKCPLILSFKSDPGSDTYYQMAGADVTGGWADNLCANPAPPADDVDGLELWGPWYDDDTNMFSLTGDPYGVAVYRFYPGTHTSVAYITTVALKLALETNEDIDLDALMVFDIDDDDTFGPGDSIMFSIKETMSGGGIYDGGEIWVWTFGSLANFLVHGGEVWNTAHAVGLHFGHGIEEVDGLEAVPEPVTMALLALGIGGLLLRRKRQ